MATNYEDYLKNKNQKTQRLIEASTRPESSDRDDKRFWKPTLDKERGVGGAIIRFLPVADDSTLDFVDFTQYAFKWESTNQWLIMKSRYKLGLITGSKEDGTDPIYELRQRLYATGQDIDKKVAQILRANKVYIANILVVKDPANPENNGKQFLYRYNATIQKLIETALKPEPDPLTGEVAPVLDAFDMVDGANLEIRVSMTDNGWNYSGTKWATPSTLISSPEDFDKLMGNVYSLKEFVAPETFPTYDALLKRLQTVIGADYVGSGVPVVLGSGSANIPTQAPKAAQEKPTPTPKAADPSDDGKPPFDIDDDAEFAKMMAEI